MELLERIRLDIIDFAGYESEEHRRLSDEQIRAFVGEALASLSDGDVEAFDPSLRDTYDRMLLRAEFMNQQAFSRFAQDATMEKIAAVLAADAALIDATRAMDLLGLDRAFDERDAAMRLG